MLRFLIIFVFMFCRNLFVWSGLIGLFICLMLNLIMNVIVVSVSFVSVWRLLCVGEGWWCEVRFVLIVFMLCLN